MGEESSLDEKNRRRTTSNKPEKKSSSKQAQQDQAGAYSPDEIPATFSSFILSLATSALISLGEEKDPVSGKKSIELSNARQVIGLIELLEGKTQGNLTKEEEHLVRQLLYTLRMKFVALEKKDSI